jgi:hypothetical protein
MGTPSFTVNNMTVSPALAVAKIVPSALNAKEVSVELWAVNFINMVWVFVSQKMSSAPWGSTTHTCSQGCCRQS